MRNFAGLAALQQLDTDSLALFSTRCRSRRDLRLAIACTCTDPRFRDAAQPIFVPSTRSRCDI